MFGRFKKKETTEKLETFADAIADVGYWNWWTADFPAFFMLEFGGTQIWTEPKENEPPSGQIGITFQQPYSVSFITRNAYQEETLENWADLLHTDKLEPPDIEHGQFTFTNIELIEQIIKSSKKIETVFGYEPNHPNFKTAEYQFGFWAGNFGCIISCKALKVVSHDGELTLKNVDERIDKWWKYWNQYWEKRDSENPLPQDYACEVTIPAGRSIKTKN